jgi:hypothetical protein
MNINHHSDHRPEIGSGKPIKLPPKRDWSKKTTFGGVSWSPELCRDPPSPDKRLGAQGAEVWAAQFGERAKAAFVQPLSQLLGEPMKLSRDDASRLYNVPPGASFVNYARRRGSQRWGWRGRIVVEHWPIADSEFALHAGRAVQDMIEDRAGDLRVCARNRWRPEPFRFVILSLPRSWAWAGEARQLAPSEVAGALPVVIGMAESFPILEALAACAPLSMSSGDAGIAAARRRRTQAIH